MNCRRTGAALLSVGALLSRPSEGGGLRRKRIESSNQYKSSGQELPEVPIQPQQEHRAPSLRLLNNRRMSEESDGAFNVDADASRGSTGDELARRFFLPPSHEEHDDIDLRQLILEMNFDGSMSMITDKPTQRPTMRPTKRPTTSPTASPTVLASAPPSTSTAPTLTDCDNPGTCQNRLRDQIYEVSVRVGTVDQLQFTNSPQYLASEWILEECDAVIPIDPCTASQIILNEQRYALAVMYFSLGGDDWNAGSNPGLDKRAPEGTWLSGLNYCSWGTEISGANGSYNQLVCDQFGNVLNLNLREFTARETSK